MKNMWAFYEIIELLLLVLPYCCPPCAENVKRNIISSEACGRWQQRKRIHLRSNSVLGMPDMPPLVPWLLGALPFRFETVSCCNWQNLPWLHLTRPDHTLTRLKLSSKELGYLARLSKSWKGRGVDVCSWWVARFLTVRRLVTYSH